MNGVHDMGGMHDFGTVEPEPNQPVFHSAWEGRVVALYFAMAYTGEWNIDMTRAAREGLPAHVYLGFAEFRSRAFQGRQGRRDQSARISANDLTFTLKVA